MKRFIVKGITVVLLAAALAFPLASPAFAIQNPTTGQPGAPTNTCGPANPVTPGNAANSPGSPFNANGQAGVVYAGNPGTASLDHSNSTAAVSQYDVACVQLSH
jgi:hypothetical protein